MSSTGAPSVVIVSADGTLQGVDALLQRAGLRTVRLRSGTARPVDARAWMKRLSRSPTPDTVVATSRVAVGWGIERWRRAVGRLPPSLEVWAAGPGTAAAVRAAGIRRVHTPRAVGSAALARSLAAGPRRRIVYFRSARAGTELARALRRRGHQVLDLIVYRLDVPSTLGARDRRELRAAALLVVTSPSGLAGLRRRMGGAGFDRLRRTARLVVLGERSRRSAIGHGFRDVSVAPSTTAERFTRHLLGELRHVRT